jgi:FixJ family two-component response regulator
VICLDNGSKAVDYVLNDTEKSIKGMIFDMTIPGGMGGKEAVEIIRKHGVKTPIIVASGYSDDPVMAKPQDFGFTASIRKPFTHKELRNILIRYIKTDSN